ncbi:MAG: T9SS type A sorting domain-containing protein [Fibrobacterota bacterium]
MSIQRIVCLFLLFLLLSSWKMTASAQETNILVLSPDTHFVANDNGGWAQYEAGNFLEYTAQPPREDYHDIIDWWHGRMGTLLDLNLDHKSVRSDWSGYTCLRFEVYNTASPLRIGVQVQDGSGPYTGGYTGVFSRRFSFDLPAGDTVTCNFPLQEVATAGELDLTKMLGFFLFRSGYSGNTELYFKNIRLVGSGTSGYTTLNPNEAVGPFSRQVCKTAPPAVDSAGLVRTLGTVSAIGPVTAVSFSGGYACSHGHFGGSGATYYQVLRRAVSVYDDNRIAFLAGGNVSTIAGGVIASRPTTCEGGSIVAMGSFDGGLTWGGILEGESRPAYLNHWYWRSNGSSSHISGDIYFLGTQNCMSYHSEVDMFFRRLKFTGNGWIEDRFSIIDQIRKCPYFSMALELPSSRLWAAVGDGFAGNNINSKYSDDDGRTWAPCKDASASAPRPFYVAGVDPVPDSVLQFPGYSIVGPTLVPVNDGHVAAFSRTGYKWMEHDGTNWSAVRTIGYWGKGVGEWSNLYNWVDATVINGNEVFLSKGGYYDNGYTTERVTDLEVNHLVNCTTWQLDTLEQDSVTESIITASGSAVYCFYVHKTGGQYVVKYRRYHDGTWSVAATLATQSKAINRFAAPQICPPNFAVVLWDEMYSSSSEMTNIHYVRVPNPDFTVSVQQPGVTSKAALKTALSGITPTPCRDIAQFHYTLGQKGPVLLQVYDIRGKLVRTLEATMRLPGSYRIQWNVSKVPANIYFIKYTAGSVRQSRKLVILR